MRNLIALVGIATLAACNDQPVVEPTNVQDDASAKATPTAAGDVPANVVEVDQGTAMAPQAFANAMAASDAFELESARLVTAQVENGPMRAFAERMIQDHGRSTAMLKEAAQDLRPDPTLNPMQRQMIADLEQAGVGEIAGRYREQQLEAHRMALQMLTGFAARGEHERLRAFAAQTAPVVQEHLSMLERM